MRRINVVGTTGSGKTVFARELAARLGYPYFELDALYWGPNWTEPSREMFRERVQQALTGDRWVVDGNYSKVRDIVWDRAETLVWLDYPLWLILWRLFARTVSRVFVRHELWSGNRESFRDAFLSRNSLFVWALQTYGRRRRDYVLIPRQPEYAHLSVVRLNSPKATRAWLERQSSTPIPLGASTIPSPVGRGRG